MRIAPVLCGVLIVLSLVAMGLLDQVNDVYELNDTARRYLVSDGPATMAALVDLQLVAAGLIFGTASLVHWAVDAGVLLGLVTVGRAVTSWLVDVLSARASAQVTAVITSLK